MNTNETKQEQLKKFKSEFNFFLHTSNTIYINHIRKFISSMNKVILLVVLFVSPFLDIKGEVLFFAPTGEEINSETWIYIVYLDDSNLEGVISVKSAKLISKELSKNMNYWDSKMYRQLISLEHGRYKHGSYGDYLEYVRDKSTPSYYVYLDDHSTMGTTFGTHIDRRYYAVSRDKKSLIRWFDYGSGIENKRYYDNINPQTLYIDEYDFLN